jgi:hypothetical protein
MTEMTSPRHWFAGFSLKDPGTVYASRDDTDWDRMSHNKSEIHIDVSHPRQPLVKGERLVRYEVNTVMVYMCRVSNTNLKITQLGYLANAEMQMRTCRAGLYLAQQHNWPTGLRARCSRRRARTGQHIRVTTRAQHIKICTARKFRAGGTSGRCAAENGYDARS